MWCLVNAFLIGGISIIIFLTLQKALKISGKSPIHLKYWDQCFQQNKVLLILGVFLTTAAIYLVFTFIQADKIKCRDGFLCGGAFGD
uniref:Uncharacterized protein n=1 Tax=Megaviridae environmental sample TaxID=1737588 RepID=A0A5J6VI52_9VIRU|nr:MAG: hypothetical protein [Megaviridae environmental sample]